MEEANGHVTSRVNVFLMRSCSKPDLQCATVRGKKGTVKTSKSFEFLQFKREKDTQDYTSS